MAGFVYILSAALSALCAFMLLRGYSQNRFKLLFWSGVCFLGFALNNVILFVDIVVTEQDLYMFRTMPGFVGVSLLVYGLVME